MKQNFFTRIKNSIDKEVDKAGRSFTNITGSIASNKKIGIKVKSIMQKPVFVNENASKKELYNIARKNPTTKIFIIVDKDKKFKGDIHEDDLFLTLVPNDSYSSIGVSLALDLQNKFFAKKAKDLMRKYSLCCYEDDDILDVALSFIKTEINEMPVLNKKGQVVGIITQGILVRHLKQ